MVLATLFDDLHSRFVDQGAATTGPKYVQLYQVILTAIRDGVLAPGDRLPPEQVMSDNLPVSLVTVRKCFELLAQRGVISREHGRGTFISSAEQSVSDLWHFRFVDPDRDGFMPIYTRILSRTIKRQPHIARGLLCPGAALVCIERAINIGSRFNCYSELFLPEGRFSGVMNEPINELERFNLKDVLTQNYRMPTLRVEQTVRIETVPERAYNQMDVEPGAVVLSLHATGYSFDDLPITFQRIWIPKTEYSLDLPSLAGPAEQQSARPDLKVVGRG